MSLSIVVNGGGTFSASMEEGPVSFMATLGAVPGPKGDTGDTGPAGVVAATAPIVYTSGTQTVSMDTTYFVRSPETAATDGQILSWDGATSRPLWIANDARTLFINGTNKTGSSIPARTVVYISGATGSHAEITPAQANAESTSARTIGITSEAIANNGTGKVITAGLLENVDTSAYTAGQGLYLSATTAGGFATSLPTQPYHGVFLGVVTRSNANTGAIEVHIQNYQELSELSDVLIGTKANLDLISWDAASSTWANKSFATLGLATTSDLNNYYTQSEVDAAFQTIAGMSDYLSKAGNLSGLASVATARTNLDVYSKAESDALVPSVPDASTTVKGIVELATDAEAVAGTSTGLAVTPSGIRNDYRPGWMFPDISQSTAVVSTGQTYIAPFGVTTRLNSSASGQYAIRYFGNTGFTVVGYSPGLSARCDFSHRCAITGLGVLINPDSAITARVKWAQNGNPTAPEDLDDPGIGLRIVGTGAVELQVHDGTTLTNVTSSFTPTSGVPFRYLIESDGSGNVTLYVDSGTGLTSVATTTSGPTGQSSQYPLLVQEVESTGTSATTTTLTVIQHALLLA